MNFGLFYQPELHRRHGTFCFCNEIDVLNGAFIKSDCPVGIVASHRRRNVEAVRQFYINRHICIRIQFCGKITFVGRVINNKTAALDIRPAWRYVVDKAASD